MNQNDIGGSKDLCKYRLETAGENLRSAKILLESGDFKGANNRAYYSAFHAMQAVHALAEKSYKSHKETLGNFNKDYFRTGVFPDKLGRSINNMEEIRRHSDYDDFYIASRQDAQEQIESAEEFLIMVTDYCQQRMAAADAPAKS